MILGLWEPSSRLHGRLSVLDDARPLPAWPLPMLSGGDRIVALLPGNPLFHADGSRLPHRPGPAVSPSGNFRRYKSPFGIF